MGTVLLYLAGSVVAALLAVVIGAVGYSVTAAINEARARQTWALVAVGEGDPVELSRWASWGTCEGVRQGMALEQYERRGVAPALRCQGVKSWWELLNSDK